MFNSECKIPAGLFVLSLIFLTVKITAGKDIPDELKSEVDRVHLMGRIVNGTRAYLGQFPHQVSLRYSWNNAHFCGGSIIDREWILTAAHCMYLSSGVQVQPSMIEVVAGDLWLNQTSATGQSSITSQIIIHENYDREANLHDIALLRLETPLNFTNSSVLPQVLQRQNLSVGAMCYVAGWGYPAWDIYNVMNELMYVDVPIVSKPLCQQFYQQFLDLSDGMICAGYTEGMKDACQGDSGGGLVCGGVLSGIVSSGYGCAWPRYPGIYTDVRYYRNWVLQRSGIEDKTNGVGVVGLSPWAVSLSLVITVVITGSLEHRGIP